MTRRFSVIAISVIALLIVVFLLVWSDSVARTNFVWGPDGINLVKNGSFEDPKDPPPGEIDVGDCKLLCDGSTTIANWVVSGHGALNPQPCPTGSGKANDAVCWAFQHTEGNPAAEDGIRSVDLTGFNGRAPNQYGAVSQAVPTERGKRYEMSFWIGSSSKFTRGAETLQVVVQIDGVTSGAFFTPLPQNVSQWDQVKMPPNSSFGFTANSETTTLKFIGAASKGDGGDYIGLDNVSLQKVCFIVIAVLFGCP